MIGGQHNIYYHLSQMVAKWLLIFEDIGFFSKQCFHNAITVYGNIFKTHVLLPNLPLPPPPEKNLKSCCNKRNYSNYTFQWQLNSAQSVAYYGAINYLSRPEVLFNGCLWFVIGRIKSLFVCFLFSRFLGCCHKSYYDWHQQKMQCCLLGFELQSLHNIETRCSKACSPRMDLILTPIMHCPLSKPQGRVYTRIHELSQIH